MNGLERFLQTFFNPVVIAAYWRDILAGVGTTVAVGVATIIAGIALGLLLACIRCYGLKPINVAIICFADIFRALPPLILILILYFGLPSTGIIIPGPVVLFISLSLALAAFAEEIFWAGFAAVEKGQWEAGIATGLGYNQTLVYIALPLAVRLATPPLVNRALAITKMTALGSVIGVPEILSAATSAQSFSGSATPLSLAAIAYLLLFLPLVFLARYLETHRRWNGS